MMDFQEFATVRLTPIRSASIHNDIIKWRKCEPQADHLPAIQYLCKVHLPSRANRRTLRASTSFSPLDRSLEIASALSNDAHYFHYQLLYTERIDLIFVDPNDTRRFNSSAKPAREKKSYRHRLSHERLTKCQAGCTKTNRFFMPSRSPSLPLLHFIDHLYNAFYCKFVLAITQISYHRCKTWMQHSHFFINKILRLF